MLNTPLEGRRDRPRSRRLPFLDLQALAAAQRSDGDQRKEALLAAADNLFGACLEARGVEGRDANRWLSERELLDSRVIVEGVRRYAEALVPDGRWVFDRAVLAGD